jgi:hypothetical protein
VGPRVTDLKTVDINDGSTRVLERVAGRRTRRLRLSSPGAGGGRGLVQIARRQGDAARRVLLRRNTALIAFGLVHATLLYFGDFTGETLRIDVGDNGTGGADPAHGTGLRGIIDRLDAIDARLRVDSPAGGPTLVTVTIPVDPH